MKLFGLQTESLNGALGVVISAPVEGRVGVNLGAHGIKSIKIVNLHMVDCEWKPSDEKDDDGCSRFEESTEDGKLTDQTDSNAQANHRDLSMEAKTSSGLEVKTAPRDAFLGLIVTTMTPRAFTSEEEVITVYKGY